jgi:hypothetical protein
VNIAFWSNSYERSCAFYNFVAISIASVLRYPYTVTTLENFLGSDNIARAFLGENIRNHIREGVTGFYEGSGIEGLLRRIYRGDNCPSILRGYWQEVIPNHLYYIPKGGVINSELFDYELNYNLKELLGIIKKNSDLCYINITQQNHLSSKAILHEADLIVINLYQNPDYLDYFFNNYSSLIHKSIFVIGNYSRSSPMSCKRISRYYDIPLENISPIPYNEYFSIVCRYGGAKEFINSNYHCLKDSPNYLFIHGIRKATFAIAKKLEESLALGKEEIESCSI